MIKQMPEDSYKDVHQNVGYDEERKGTNSKFPTVGDQLSQLRSNPTVRYCAAVENEDGDLCLPAELPDYILISIFSQHPVPSSFPCNYHSLIILVFMCSLNTHLLPPLSFSLSLSLTHTHTHSQAGRSMRIGTMPILLFMISQDL